MVDGRWWMDDRERSGNPCICKIKVDCFTGSSIHHLPYTIHDWPGVITQRTTPMHEIEPYYNWRHIYVSEEDERSPFFGRVYSEFEYTQAIYNYLIHPQWDDFGSRTLYLKVLLADYEEKYAIIELIGEWNDAIEKDIMSLKREVADPFMVQGIFKFIFITENVLNFHSGDKDYYEEWYEES